MTETYTEDDSYHLQLILTSNLEELARIIPTSFEYKDLMARYLARQLYAVVVSVETLEKERQRRQEQEEMLDMLQGRVRALFQQLDNEHTCKYVQWGKRCPKGYECSMCRVYEVLDWHEERFRKAVRGS